MRVITFRRIKEFSEKHADAEIPLRFWYAVTSKKKWFTLNDIKKDFNSVDYVGNHRFVFNIKGNRIDITFEQVCIFHAIDSVDLNRTVVG